MPVKAEILFCFTNHLFQLFFKLKLQTFLLLASRTGRADAYLCPIVGLGSQKSFQL